MTNVRVFSLLALLAAALMLILHFAGAAGGAENVILGIGLLLLSVGVLSGM